MKFSIKLLLFSILLLTAVISILLLTAVTPLQKQKASLAFFDATKISNSQIQEFIKTTVPQKSLIENITFAINKDFANEHPDWKNRADRVVEDINIIYSKNTKKKFKIAKYIIYDAYEYGSPNTSIDKLFRDTSSYYNTTAVNPCDAGMLLIYFVGDESVNLGRSTGGSNYFPEVNKVLGFAVIRETKTNSTLLKESIPFAVDLETTYWLRLSVLIHEIGHSLGLASPEWYNYEYIDLTGAPPLLAPYSLNEKYPMDPMTAAGGTPILYPDKLWEFSDVNAFIINHGLCRPLTLGQMDMARAQKVIVRIKDKNGNAVKNAKVNVFGINHEFKRYSKEDAKYFILKQSIRTDSKGMATIKDPQELAETPPVTAAFYSEIVKISKNEKYGGAYITIADLQRTRWLKNSNIHYVDIIIE